MSFQDDSQKFQIATLWQLNADLSGDSMSSLTGEEFSTLAGFTYPLEANASMVKYPANTLDENYTTGTTGSTIYFKGPNPASEINTRWVGGVKPRRVYFTESNFNNTYLLAGTRPLNGSVHVDDTMRDAGYYFVQRTSAGIVIYKCNVSIDFSIGIITISNLSHSKTIAASRYHDKVTPIRMIVSATGAGGGGAHGSMYYAAGGGGAGGTAVGVVDFLTFPSLVCAVGTGGSAGKAGSTSEVFGILNVYPQSNGTYTAYVSELVELLVGKGGAGGTSNKGGTGGDFVNNLPTKWQLGNTAANYGTPGGGYGGSGGAPGEAGTSYTYSTTISTNTEISESYRCIDKNLPGGGVSSSTNGGGGGGASAWSAGAKGGIWDTTAASGVYGAGGGGGGLTGKSGTTLPGSGGNGIITLIY